MFRRRADSGAREGEGAVSDPDAAHERRRSSATSPCPGSGQASREMGQIVQTSIRGAAFYEDHGRDSVRGLNASSGGSESPPMS
jgi:hypothetical protein